MLPLNAALLINDLRKAIDNPLWMSNGLRNNPGAEATIAQISNPIIVIVSTVVLPSGPNCGDDRRSDEPSTASGTDSRQ